MRQTCLSLVNVGYISHNLYFEIHLCALYYRVTSEWESLRAAVSHAGEKQRFVPRKYKHVTVVDPVKSAAVFSDRLSW